MRKLIRRIVLWAVPEAAERGLTVHPVYVVGDSFAEDTPRRRVAEIKRRAQEGN